MRLSSVVVRTLPMTVFLIACAPGSGRAACTLYPAAADHPAQSPASPECRTRGTFGGVKISIPDRYVRSFVEYADDDVWGKGFQPEQKDVNAPIRSFSIPIRRGSWRPVESAADREAYDVDQNAERAGASSAWVTVQFSYSKPKFAEKQSFESLLSILLGQGGTIKARERVCGLNHVIFSDIRSSESTSSSHVFSSYSGKILVSCDEVHRDDGKRLYMCHQYGFALRPGVRLTSWYDGQDVVCDWKRIEHSARAVEAELEKGASSE